MALVTPESQTVTVSVGFSFISVEFELSVLHDELTRQSRCFLFGRKSSLKNIADVSLLEQRKLSDYCYLTNVNTFLSSQS